MNNALFFEPTGIAIIGASREAGKLGHDVVRNLVANDYTGAIHPVNPKAADVLGYPCYADVATVPDPVDLAIVVLPAPMVAGALKACGQRGIQAVIVVSGGFGELGADGTAREAEIKAIAADYNIALLGPNCIGTIDTHRNLNTTFVMGYPPSGAIALVSQSGALAATVIDWAQKAHIGFSRMVSLGNQAGVSEADMLTVCAADTHTRVLALYMEGVADGQDFIEQASAASLTKPIVALKAGRSTGGAQAVASHTGSLAGAESAYDAAFRRSGVLRVTTLEELLDWSQALAMQPLPNGNRVAVLTNAGGPGILAVDALEMAGMELAPLTEATKQHLRERIPPAGSVNNPVDILAGSGPATYALCLDALLRDETVDAVIVITAPQDWFEATTLAELVGDLNGSPVGRKKTVLSVIMGPTADSPAAEILRKRNVPNFVFPERAGRALGAMWERQQWLNAQIDETAPMLPVDKAALAELFQHEGWLPATATEKLLSTYNIPTPQMAVAQSIDEALPLAEKLGYPLVLKLQLADVSHKTDIGGVLVGIDSPAALKSAFAELLAKVPDDAQFEGVMLQQQIQGVAEVIIGVVRDPQFGALLMVGSGGTQVELLGDVAFELAPLSHTQAESMLNQTSLGTLLAGYRGKPAADTDALITMMQALAQIALDWSQISEIEINPVIVGEHGAVAVDVRVKV